MPREPKPGRYTCTNATPPGGGIYTMDVLEVTPTLVVWQGIYGGSPYETDINAFRGWLNPPPHETEADHWKHESE